MRMAAEPCLPELLGLEAPLACGTRGLLNVGVVCGASVNV